MQKRIFAVTILLSVLLLGSNLIFRLINQSQILIYFPLDYTSDIAAYMAQLHFLKVCGFHEFCPYWYGGFIAFLHTPPGWFYFALPFYNIFGDVKVATYFAMVLEFLIAFALFLYFGRFLGLTKIKRIAFFLVVFANAISIGNFVRLGRVHELLAWIFFCILAFTLFYYKDRKLDIRFFLVAPLFALIILSYQSVGVLSAFLLLGFFLARNYREKILVMLTLGAGLLLSAFWWLQFVTRISDSSILDLKQSRMLISGGEFILTQIASVLIPILLLAFLVIYWKEHNFKKKEVLFFLPVFILSILFLFRLNIFIPVLDAIIPDPYILFFIFFIAYLLFSINPNDKFKALMFTAILLIFILFSIFANVVHTPTFAAPDKQLVFELDSLLEELDGSFLLAGDFNRQVYGRVLYSYAAIYFNASTPSGMYWEVKPVEYTNKLELFFKSVEDKDCANIVSLAQQIKVDNLISDKEHCRTLSACQLKLVKETELTCLYRIS